MAGVTLSSDFIVGFCGETKVGVSLTVRIVNHVLFVNHIAPRNAGLTQGGPRGDAVAGP